MRIKRSSNHEFRRIFRKEINKGRIKELNDNNKLEKIEESKEDNNQRLIITLPNEIVDIVNNDTECKKILKSNIVKFVRELKKELEFERGIVSIDTISYI